MCGQSDEGNVLGLRGAFQTTRNFPAVNNGHRRTATVTLSRNYIHRSMARRTRIEYSATHMMSEVQPRLSSTACSLMVNSPWRSNAMGPPPSHTKPDTKRMERSLGQTSILPNRRDGFVGRDCKKRQLFTEGGL